MLPIFWGLIFSFAVPSFLISLQIQYYLFYTRQRMHLSSWLLVNYATLSKLLTFSFLETKHKFSLHFIYTLPRSKKPYRILKILSRKFPWYDMVVFFKRCYNKAVGRIAVTAYCQNTCDSAFSSFLPLFSFLRQMQWQLPVLVCLYKFLRYNRRTPPASAAALCSARFLPGTAPGIGRIFPAGRFLYLFWHIQLPSCTAPVTRRCPSAFVRS